MSDPSLILERMERAQASLIARHAPGMRTRQQRWSGGETRVLELGEGPPLLLVHGGLGSACEWIPVVGRLARHHRVIAIDRPGHGFATAFDYRKVDLADHGARFLGEVLDAVELDAANLVGNSIGGYLTAAFAMAHPQRVARLVLMGKPVGCNRGAPAPLRLLGLPIIGSALARLAMSNPTPAANRKFWGDVLVANATALDDDLIEVDCAHQSRNLASLLGLLRRVAAPGGTRRELVFGERWRELSMPTLLLWGQHDAFGPPHQAEAITSMTRQAHLIEVPGAGHLPWLDNPELCAASLESFLHPDPPVEAGGRASQHVASDPGAAI